MCGVSANNPESTTLMPGGVDMTKPCVSPRGSSVGWLEACPDTVLPTLDISNLRSSRGISAFICAICSLSDLVEVTLLGGSSETPDTADAAEDGAIPGDAFHGSDADHGSGSS